MAKRNEEYIQNKIKKHYREKNIKKYYCKKKIKKYYQKKNIDESYKNDHISKYYLNKMKIYKQVEIYRKIGKEDVIYQIINNLASRINNELAKRNIKRIITYSEYLGCTPSFFKAYLENKFTGKMNYDNYGKWEVDHIFPVSKINFNDASDILRCFHYTNLQPLWKPDNMKKSNKTI